MGLLTFGVREVQTSTATALRRISMLFAAPLMLIASVSASAQTITFTQSFVNASAGGAPFTATVETRDSGGAPALIGSLTWNLSSCSSLASFSGTPPSVVDSDGFTDAFVSPNLEGSCALSVTWDPDFTGPTPPVTTGEPLNINIGPAGGPTVEYVFSSIEANVGNTFFADIQTTGGSGPLIWQLGTSCSGIANFNTPAPTFPATSGPTSAELIAQGPGTCDLNVFWDHDGNTGTPNIVPSGPALSITVFGGANPATVEFTAPDYLLFVEAGSSMNAEVVTQLLGSAAGGGTLFWDIDPMCPHAVLAPNPPATANASGSTSAVVNGISQGSCDLLVRWDHDNDSVNTPDAVPSAPLQIVVFPPPVITEAVSGPAPIIPRFENPTVTIRAIQSGMPLAGANVGWKVTYEGQTPIFFGSICSTTYTTGANGQATFDFTSFGVAPQLGDYVVEGVADSGVQCRDGKSTAQPNGPIFAPVVFNFTIEDVELFFENPTTDLPVNVPATFDVLMRTIPSNTPISGIDLDYAFDGAASPSSSGSFGPTDSGGRAILALTPTAIGFFDLQIEDPVNSFSNGISLGVFQPTLELTVAPPSQTFTDEVGAPFVVRAFQDFGFNPRTGSTKRGGPSGPPLGGVPITFSITSANGTFTANNSATFNAVTSQGLPGGNTAQPSGPIVDAGEAESSPVLIGRTGSPVGVTISSPGFASFSTSYVTTPSTYSIQRTSAPSVTIAAGETTQLVAQVLRGGISTPGPIGPNETVLWTITAPVNGATVEPVTFTDSSSNATTTFTPQVAGTYEVVGQFNPGISGVLPSSVSYTVDVTGPIIAQSLVPFEGDFTSGAAGFTFPISVRYQENGQNALPPSQATITWTVSSGDATISPSTSQLSATTGIASTNVTFGSTTGPVVVSASLLGTNANTFFYLDIVENIVLEITDPANRQLDLAAGESFDISLLLRTQQGVGLSSEFIAVSSDIADLETELVTESGGSATLSGIAPADAGSYRVEFLYEGFSSNDATSKAVGVPPLSEVVTVNVRGEDPVGNARLVQSEGDGQRGLVNSAAQPLRALYTLNEVPQPGSPILWEVVSGGGTPTSTSTLTDANGIATFNYTFGPTPGPVTIRASVGQAEALFTITGERAGLNIVSGNNQSGPVQTSADQPLIVSLTDPAGAGIPNQTIQWAITGGSAALTSGTVSGSSVQAVTDSAGRAQVSLRFGAIAGAVGIQATSGLASAPALFIAQAQTPALRIISGNNQSAEPGTRLAQDLVVSIAPGMAKALGGVSIVWEVISGGGTLATLTTPSASSGQASNQLTLGAQAGANVVRASIQGGPSVTFNATGVVTAVELTKVSGDNQAELPTNFDSAPMIVRLRRAGGGAAVANATIVWNGANAGFVINNNENTLVNQTTSVTNAQGEARIIARVIASGPATVSARLQDSVGDPLVFTLQGAIANTVALNTNQVRVAEVLDSACIALSSLSSRTAAQEDLLQRCRELQTNSGPNPDGVSDALEQLDPDVALAMTGAGLEVITTQITNINSYLIEARNNPGGRGQFKLALATADGALPLSFLPSNLLAANAAQDESAEGQDLGPDFGRWGFFASGTIGRGKYREGDRTPDYDYSSGNLTAGVDYRLNDSIILGAGLGYSSHDTDLRNDGGTLDTSGVNFIGFASWYNQRQWFVDGVLSLGRNDYDLQRNIRYNIRSNTGAITSINQVATSATKGDQLGFSLAVGRDWQTGPWSINSYLRGNYLSTEYDAYNEQTISNLPGSGLALAVDARKLTNMSSVLGSKATYVLSRDWGILMPHAQLEWEHSFEDDPTQLVTRFLADPTGTSFVQFGDDIDADFFNVGVGLSALWPGGRSAYLAYERLVSSSRLSQDTLSLGIRIEF